MRSQASQNKQSKRWRTNLPVKLTKGEVVVDQFAIGSFAFVVSNRSLFFMHAHGMDQEGRLPAVHQVPIPEGRYD